MDWITDLADELWKALLARQVESGKETIAKNRDPLRSLSPGHVDSTRLLDALARWTELMPDLLSDVDHVYKKFEEVAWEKETLLDVVHFRLAGAFLAVVHHDSEPVRRHSEAVLALASSLSDETHAGAARYCLARTLRDSCRYSDALPHATESVHLLETSQPNLAAIVRLMTSWLQFETGDVRGAKASVELAEQVLVKTQDWTNRGNLLSHHGKVVSRQRNYLEAIRQFNESIGMYMRCDPPHKNTVRALVNLAAAKRMRAKEIRKVEASNTGTSVLLEADVRRKLPEYVRLLDEAGADLRRAQELHDHDKYHDPRNQGRIVAQTGLLHLQQGKLALAERCGLEALELANATEDRVLAARGELLLFWKEYHSIRSGWVDSVHERGVMAKKHAMKAVEASSATQHLRLQTRSHVALSFSHLLAPFFDRVAAELELNEARGRLRDGEDLDHVLDEVLELEQEIERTKDQTQVVFQLTASQIIGHNLQDNVLKLEKVSVDLNEAVLGKALARKCMGVGFERIERIKKEADRDPGGKAGTAGASNTGGEQTANQIVATSD